jgi:hypothetical protein
MCEKGPAMGRRWTYAAIGAALAAGCGTRTALLVPDDGFTAYGGGADGEPEEQDASVVDSSSPPADGPYGDVVYCSLFAGQVRSCDAGRDAGTVERCTGGYTDCIKVTVPGDGSPRGLFGCCIPDPPEGVSQCIDRQLLDAQCY